MQQPFPFSDLKILDLTNEFGGYCTKLFADLGADVLKIEPPQGDSTRRIGPFFGDRADDDSSLYYLYLNTNKKSMTLDLETKSGQDIFRELVKTYDIVVESTAPGYLSGLGLGYEQLKEVNPRLIMTSITPFGQEGPYRDYLATDLIAVAMGGFMYLGGYPDSPPIRPYGNQSYYSASLFAAVGTLIAVLVRDRDGIGQYVDVSMQEAMAVALENAIQLYDLEGTVRRRTGAGNTQAGWGLYPCADGLVYLMGAGLTGTGSWEALVKWIAEAGVEGWEVLTDPKWDDASWRMKDEAKRQFYDLFTQLSLRMTKIELYEEAQRRKIPLCPVNTPGDVLTSPQLQAREFFRKVYHAPLDAEVVYPGPPYRFTEMEWSLRTPAPRKGQDTADVLKGLGYAPEDIVRLKEGGVI